MFAINTINNELKSVVSVSSLIDFYRLVDVQTHQVYEYPANSNDVIATGTTCHHIWGKNGACKNCTSAMCVFRQETIVKVMQLNGTSYLIYSIPVTIKGKDYALELIKDVTSSFMVPSIEDDDNIEIVEMINRFNEVAVHDSFTALYNKTYLMNELHEILIQAKEGNYDPEAEVVMLDLDLFKNINDELGHTVGDDILLSFALQLKHIAHSLVDGWAARYGGDEFVICAPHGFGENGHHAITQGIINFTTDVIANVEGSPRVSVSYGIAKMERNDTARSVIDRADERMYEMKQEHHSIMGENWNPRNR